MKIYNVRIQKFRSIDDASITMDQIIALVGANNAGKSHVLRSLNAFFNFADERESFLNQDHLYSSKSRPHITVVFSDIEECDEIPNEYIHNQKLTIRFTYRWDRKSPSYDVLLGRGSKAIDQDNFTQLISHFKYIYVPIVRNYEATVDSDNGIAYHLLKDILTQQISNRNTIQPLIGRIIDKVETTVFKTALRSIKKYYPFQNGAEFQMCFANTDIADMILRDVALKLVENSQVNEINNCGSGVQSAVYFAISLAISMQENANFLVGIEEPELNMHPQAQRQLIEALKKRSQYPKTQFILTTHSTVIIDKLGHTAIALCRKLQGDKRDVVTTITQLQTGFWDKYSLEEERYYNFFQYRNSDFFFSNYIVITESSNDCNVIRALLQQEGIDVEDSGLTLIPADGEKSIKYPYAIADALSIPFVCIVDRDVFQPYIKQNRKDSLDEQGVPRYLNQRKPSSPIYSLISDEDISLILEHYRKNQYQDVLETLEKYHIVAMRYALEIDLIVCSSYCNAYCDELGLECPNRTSLFLLTERSKKVKEYTVIQNVLSSVSLRNLPKSYRQIVRMIKAMIDKT